MSTGCGAREAQPVMGEYIVLQAQQPVTPVVTPIVAVTAQPAPKVFPDNIHSVTFVKTTNLYKSPTDATKIGVIKNGARAAVTEAMVADGCKTRWLHIAPRGWVCETMIEPSSEEPTTAVAFSFDHEEDGPLVPGVYGVVRGAEVSTSVRAAGVAVVDGVRYWRTTAGDLVDESTIVQFSPSKFKGVVVDGKLPAWLRNHEDSRKPVVTFAGPKGKRSGELAARTVVEALEEVDGFVRVDATAWVPRRDIKIATLAEPPPGTGKTEKWFDVDRDEQVLVAYEGTKPVYATMVSTGKWDHATPTVITRIQSKLLTATMNNDRGEKYSVADVPWTMFYDGHYALHTSYWHDGFGGQRSHGCINLSPRDARALYQWSSPDVPPGWIAVYGDADVPGSLVRVRSKQTPDPELRGYAKAMQDRDVVAGS